MTMELTSPPEMTTAITDILLGCLVLVLFFRVRALKTREPVKAGLWSWTLGLLAFASFYGAIAHAVVMSKETLALFWMPLSFVLGMMVSLFAAAMLYEWKGTRILKRAIAVMLSMGALFFAVMLVLSRFIDRYFIVFIAYSGLAMVCSLLLCLGLAVSRRDRALFLMAAGIAAIIIASIIQAMRTVSFTLLWEFDYNSVYHFILMVAVLLIYAGVKKSIPV